MRKMNYDLPSIVKKTKITEEARRATSRGLIRIEVAMHVPYRTVQDYGTERTESV